MASLGQILNDKIGKGGKSKAYVAGELGVSERTIENYMKGVRNPKPDAMVKLSKILKFDLSQLSEQNVSTTAPETPQNGKIKRPLSQVGRVVSIIEFRTRLTIGEIAAKIGVSRPHLNSIMYEGAAESPKTLDALKKEFAKELQEDTLTTATTKPDFGMKPSNGTNGKDHTISQLVNNETKLIDTNKNQQETIGKLTDLVTKLVEKR